MSGNKLLHEDAPVYKTYSVREFRKLLKGFSKVGITIARYPVKTRIYSGLKASAYNTLFVGAFNLMPRAMVRPFGAHMIAKAIR